MATRMLQRRGTAAEWAAVNPVLAEGEIGYEIDTRIMKIGDGVTEWAELSLSTLTKSATTMEGPLFPLEPTESGHAARLAEVNTRVSRSGDIMEGPLTLLAPTEDNHAARLKDVTDATTSLPADSGPPIGAVLMFSGSIESLPSSWKLCDGTNGTPDLRDRFVVGAGGAYSPGDTGGADEVTLSEGQMPAHSHSGSSGSSGSHTHGLSSVVRASQTVNYQGGDFSLAFNAASGTVSVNSAGLHSHSVSIGNTGGGEAHENRPPYYALAYIMRVA